MALEVGLKVRKVGVEGKTTSKVEREAEEWKKKRWSKLEKKPETK